MSAFSLCMKKGVYIVGAKRTPFGAFGGGLKSLTGVELGVIATQAAINDAKISPEQITACYYGNVIAAGNDAAYTSRHIALRAGCSVQTPSLTINRLCGSGFESVLQAAKDIQINDDDNSEYIAIAGGTEQMSQAPLVVPGQHIRWGTPLGTGMKLSDSLWDGLTDNYANIPMGITAENLAKQYDISRQQCDEYAIRSQQKWKNAQDNNIFDSELAPVTISTKKGDKIIQQDEHPRPESTLDKIGKLPSVFHKTDGVVTAANASGICDGAGTILVASEKAAANTEPLCRIVSISVTGCDPTIMGIGPVSAIQNALAVANLTLDDMDYIEINEAFAAQVLACAKELKIDNDMYEQKFNVHGGAISLGHPLAASGSRITAHLAHVLANNPDKKYAVGAACIGGGQGIALVLERIL